MRRGPLAWLAPYRDVLSVPGALGFSSAGALARLPISMLGLGIVLLVERTSGSYGAAGAVAGTFGLVQAFAAPTVARLVDRYGQARVMRPAVAVHVAGILALVAAAQARAPVGALLACAVVMGATIGSVGALVRARWTALLGAGPRQHTAYALESVLDEVVFIVGPVVVTVLAVEASPAWGLVAAAAAVALGGLLLLAQRRTEPVPVGARPAAGTGVLRSRGVLVVLVAFLGVGTVFGGVEVVTAAFTDERGQQGLTGWVLASFAAGSLLAGVAYGAVPWTSPSSRRFPVAVALLAAGCLPLPLVPTTAWLALVVFLAGFAISPMIISGNGVVGELVAAGRLTEGLTWVSTALGIGTAAGAAVSGAVIDAAGARAGFGVPAAAGVVAAAVAVAGARWLHPPGAVGVLETAAVPARGRPGKQAVEGCTGHHTGGPRPAA